MRRIGLLLFAGACGALSAKVEPSALFSDHAVLHRSAATPVFGFADPGEEVMVSLGAASARATADASGRWLARLDLRAAGGGPQELHVGGQVAKDVLVGEVWLSSGQSNMSFKEGSADDAQEAAKSSNPQIRCFVVETRTLTAPDPRIRGRWLVNEPGQTLGMTAVGYQFAKNVQDALKVPVGLVESAVGASTIEAWSDPETMAATPVAKQALDRQIAFMADYRGYESRCDAALRAWEVKWGRTDRPHGGGVPADGWRAPTAQEAESFGHGAGAVWFRRTLKAGAFERRRFIERQWQFDTSSVEVYWNGRRVARRFPADPIEKNTEVFDLSADAPGELAVRVFNGYHMFDVPWTFFADGRRLDRAGWQVREEYALPPCPKEAQANLPTRQRFCLRQHYPTGLYNGMVAGLVPMGLSGVLWYQGESNTTAVEAGQGPATYEALCTGLIASWRKLFGRPDLPFAWCQLASLGPKAKNPGECDSWIELRAAQQRCLKVPGTGQAILIDAGEDGDIHPRDKRTPGRRLAAWALNRVYGKDVPFRGPNVVSTRVEGNAVAVRFADAGEGLVAKDLGTRYVRVSSRNLMGDVVRNSPTAQVEGFAVRGAEDGWHWADAATIAGDTVKVSSRAVPRPVAVRYGWNKNPWVNLYNSHGLPAEPFERAASTSGK